MKNLVMYFPKLIIKVIKRIKYLMEIKFRTHTIYILIIALHWIYGYAYITGSTFYEQYINGVYASELAEPTRDKPVVIQSGSDEWVKKEWEKVGVPHEEVWAVIQSESRHNKQAWNCNTNDSLDLGLYQINLSAHPEVTPECALSVECSTKFAIELYKKQNWRPWFGARSLGLW